MININRSFNSFPSLNTNFFNLSLTKSNISQSHIDDIAEFERAMQHVKENKPLDLFPAETLKNILSTLEQQLKEQESSDYLVNSLGGNGGIIPQQMSKSIREEIQRQIDYVKQQQGTGLSTDFDKRTRFEKIVDATLAVFREIRTMVSAIFNRLFQHHPSHTLGKEITWKQDSEGLFVMIHGLFSHPADWKHQAAELKNRKFDLFVPFVPKGGDCSLEDSAGPILPYLQDYAMKHPGKPICILGHSNGGRIVASLENSMREKAPKTPIKVSIIAGIPFGTDLKLWKALRVDKWLLSKAWFKEADYHSPTAQAMLKQAKKPVEKGMGERDYEFYATTSDLIVSNLACSLPTIGKGERHFVVHGEGHFSIIKKVASRQMASCMEWMARRL